MICILLPFMRFWLAVLCPTCDLLLTPYIFNNVIQDVLYLYMYIYIHRYLHIYTESLVNKYPVSLLLGKARDQFTYT